ncbi:helix-turn-helix domain-containing protein [Pseudooceanicola sediminis]|uniref:Helix-turn-helix domain-containing protein n=2 Tax=Pseudooceanicola sediminis TaxID=2211117 RepID=A0A399J200_9RHOB|nr:helix-turn-helix domain-containing protein [Pseudooceanicola sediminis]|tara:strand:+ start:222684 stop:223553 length:870 start_codon:yes stop_codon:yes gene_type:complete
MLMPHMLRPARPRRSTPGLHQIKSPLSRIAFGLASGTSHLLWLGHGTVHLRQGDGDTTLESNGPRLLWWADGAGRELIAEIGARGTLLSIPQVTLIQSLPTTPIGAQMQRTISQDLDLAAESSSSVVRLLEGFVHERKSGEHGTDIATSHYLGLLVLQLWRLARRDLVNLGGAPQGLSERFILLAAQRVRDHRPIDDYARDLNVSRDRLGSAVKRATGLPPQAYLHRLLIREAMELLANTGMPVSQVAFRLGFVDPAYFTRFFKRETGQNPGAFRRSEDAPPQSFAAWP